MSAAKKTAIFEAVLRASKDVDYVVRGGRSYLDKVPAAALKALAAALPEYFTTGDWNVSAASTADVSKLCDRVKAAYAAAKTPVRISLSVNDKSVRYLVESSKVPVGWITDVSQSSVGKTDGRCRDLQSKSVTTKGVRYSSLCDCLSQMHRALSSETFAKGLKTALRARAILNLAKPPGTGYAAGLVKQLWRDLSPPHSQKGGCKQQGGGCDDYDQTTQEGAEAAYKAGC